MKLEEIDLYVTNKCNLKCSFCSVKAGNYDAEIPLEKIKQLIDEAVKFGLKDLHMTGGEPTIRRDLENIIEYAVFKKLNVRLITNGTLITKQRLDSLFEHGLKSIMISLDGTEEYHDKVRGVNGAYKRAYETIKYAIDKKMFVRVNSVAWKDNMDEILKLLELFNELKIDVYSIFLGSPLGYAINEKNNVIEPTTWRRFCEKVKFQVIKNNYHTKVVMEKGYLYNDEEHDSVLGLEGRGRGCYEITKYTDFLLIRSNGDIYPCVFYSNEADPIGNIYEGSIESIVEKFKNNLIYKKLGEVPSSCEKCKEVKYCHGGCRGYAKLCFNNWFDKDPRCGKTKGENIIPLCPIVKININDDIIGGSSEQVL